MRAISRKKHDADGRPSLENDHGNVRLRRPRARRTPASENFLFSSVGLSFEDLNNKGGVVFTVKWPKRD
jgi:hypothetical protein